MVPEIGQKYGPYEILSTLGRGGMGAVFLAWDSRLHREVAIKLLHDDLSMPGMRERFLREARAASALSHPNIRTIFDFGEENGEPYMVLELLHGESLKERISLGALPTEDILLYGLEISDALAAAHAKGIIHRDIKPANIFLVPRPNGTCQSKVLDFGLAKIERNDASRSLEITTAGATVGTVAYMSPEQARGEDLDARSDLFSFGVVLYEMATGQVPFGGQTSAVVFSQLLGKDPHPVRDWNERIPKDVEKIIHKLLCKDRKDRFQNGTELHEAFQKVLSGKKTNPLRPRPTAVPTRSPLGAPVDPVARDRRPIPPRRNSGSTGSFQHARASEQRPAQPPPQQGTPAPSDQPRSIMDVPLDPWRPPSNRDIPVAVTAAAPPQQDASLRPSTWQSDANRIPAVDLDDATYNPAAPRVPTARLARRRRNRLLAVAALTLVVIGAIAFFFYNRRPNAAPITAGQPILLGPIDNQTGDSGLDGLVGQALAIQLAQAPSLNLRGRYTFLNALKTANADGNTTLTPDLIRQMAKQSATHRYLIGSISGTAPYTLHIDLKNSDDGATLGSAEETATSRAQLLPVITKIAEDIRQTLGESPETIAQNSVPLDQEATASPEALFAFATAETAVAEHRLTDAVTNYEHAIELDPTFTLARLNSIAVYRALRADAAAGAAASAAHQQPPRGSRRQRLLVDFNYQLNTLGDSTQAIDTAHQLLQLYPHDATGFSSLAGALRRQSRFTEALQAAQKGLDVDAEDPSARNQVQLALIGLDRDEAVLQQRNATTQPASGTLLLAAAIMDRQDIVTAQRQAIAAIPDDYAQQGDLALYLDATGQLSSGLQLWRSTAERATRQPGLQSAAASLLSQAAIDRAMAGDCATALPLAREALSHPAWITALYNAAMSQALCSDPAADKTMATLQSTYPSSIVVNGFYLNTLRAAIALRSGHPQATLDALNSAATRQYDAISLGPWLRGLAHIALQQDQLAILDFQFVLAHRGATVVSGNVAYPMAQLGLARAYAAIGDKGNAANAYNRFLDLWKSGDRTNPLIAEAHAHSAAH